MESKLIYKLERGKVVKSEDFEGFYDLNIQDGNIVYAWKRG